MPSTETVTVYVRRLGLAHTNEYRPVLARHVTADIYSILPQEIPPGEQWEFQPGDQVYCEASALRHHHAKEALLARRLVV